MQGFKIPLAMIGLVCLEARVKFNFHSEADFASYCRLNRFNIFSFPPIDSSALLNYCSLSLLTRTDTDFAT